jgi:hypothetical protein
VSRPSTRDGFVRCGLSPEYSPHADSVTATRSRSSRSHQLGSLRRSTTSHSRDPPTTTPRWSRVMNTWSESARSLSRRREWRLPRLIHVVIRLLPRAVEVSPLPRSSHLCAALRVVLIASQTRNQEVRGGQETARPQEVRQADPGGEAQAARDGQEGVPGQGAGSQEE